MTQQSIIPALRYVDAPAAIEFLCTAFGFERHSVCADDKDPTIIQHAELRLGNSLVMLSSARSGPATEMYRWKTPAEAGGVTACVACVIDDPDAHFARAKAAGGDLVTEPHDNEGYPGRSYNVRDPEGHNWDFGTYDAWAQG